MSAVEADALDRYDEERARRFYSKLRRRVDRWLAKTTPVGEGVRDVLFLLPDLFILVVRLIGDSRIKRGLRLKLVAVSAYVISPIDILPDLLIPFGLTDDAFALAIVLSHVIAMMSDAEESVLREHWEGDGDVIVQIQKVATKADNLLNMKVTKLVRRFFL
jgi:uncharacterized membrane protein YkvA (DUF1232 family)